MKRSLLAFGLAFTLLACSTACERRGATTTGDGTGAIKVGVYMDLSGQTASFGQSSVNGAKMAVDEINKSGGVNGRQIELVIEDDQGLPAQAKTVATKLVNQDRVDALFGEVASSNSLAAAPVAQDAKIPMVTPSSTNPKVTEVGDFIFRTCFIDPFQGEVMAKFAANTLKAKRVAMFTDVSSDYSRGMAQFFEAAFKKSGGEIIESQSYTNTDRDFSGQLTQIAAKKPDAIFVPGYYSQVGVIARQAREKGYTNPLLGGDGWDSPELFNLGGQALNNSFISNHYSVDDPNPVVQKFVADFKARYNTAPDAIAATAYDGMRVLADAFKRAGGTDRQKVRDALAATQNFVGVTGTISIDANRNAIKPAAVFELKDGRYVFRETVYPDGVTPPASATTGASPMASPSTSPMASPMMSPGASPATAASPASGTNANNANTTNNANTSVPPPPPAAPRTP